MHLRDHCRSRSRKIRGENAQKKEDVLVSKRKKRNELSGGSREAAKTKRKKKEKKNRKRGKDWKGKLSDVTEECYVNV